MSNITPQDKDLNQGPWKELEDAVRDAATYEHPLYVVTGPVYDKPMRNLPNADEPHSVPSGYYKIVYDRSGGVSFLMNQDSQRKDNYCAKIVDFAVVQGHVKYSLPAIEKSVRLVKQLGCIN